MKSVFVLAGIISLCFSFIILLLVEPFGDNWYTLVWIFVMTSVFGFIVTFPLFALISSVLLDIKNFMKVKK